MAELVDTGIGIWKYMYTTTQKQNKLKSESWWNVWAFYAITRGLTIDEAYPFAIPNIFSFLALDLKQMITTNQKLGYYNKQPTKKTYEHVNKR